MIDTPPDPDVRHILTVRGDPRGRVEYELAHPGCRASVMEVVDEDGDGVRQYASFDCGVGFLVGQEGLLDTIGVKGWKGLGPEVKHLEPGRYVVEYHSSTYPATPNGPEEFDAWLEVDRLPDEEKADGT